MLSGCWFARWPLPGLGLAVLLLAPQPSAQRSKTAPAPTVDPYTGAEPARLERAGYVSFGPFLFGRETTETIASNLGETILWVETEHYRIGSTLEECRLEEGDERREVGDELDRLRKRIDGLPAKAPRRLDPWLRLHLSAARLEALHAELCARLGVLASAPEVSSDTPCLKVPNKFQVLLTQRKSTLARFTRAYWGEERGDVALRASSGSVGFGVSSEALDDVESFLHVALLYHATQAFLCGINGYRHVLPAWWMHGVSLWVAREHMPRIMLYSMRAGGSLPGKELADWRGLARGRVEGGTALGWSELLERTAWPADSLGDNALLWAHLDQLFQEDRARTLVPWLHARGSEPPDGAAALAQATGHGLEELDAGWSAWVREHYGRR